ncbi:Sir2 family NAD-dependent protein deacetylase [Pseudomonas pergaminensis]|uniref:Sir2 family NAD-dependent protein deacetylase n=1 Tax=Pseudomonas pergaminensis TaxID=2853159 RepID=UPI003F68955B
MPRPYLLLRKLGKSPNCFGSFLGCLLSKVSLSSYLVDEFTWGLWVTLNLRKKADPALCWGWYEWRRQKVIQAQPKGAHRAIAALANHVPKLTVVTQNVDDLHERAGSQDVIHLHGSLHSPRCIDCGLAYTLPLTTDALPEDGSRIEPPLCSACSGYVRPCVVWFGEMLSEDAWSAGLAAAEDCDFFLLIGTSGIVYPAAELPLRALGRGATVVHINPVRFDISSQERFLQGPASMMMMKGLFRETFGDFPTS